LKLGKSFLFFLKKRVQVEILDEKTIRMKGSMSEFGIYSL